MASTPGSQRGTPERVAGTALLRGIVVAITLAVVGLTWIRLFEGLFLDDESGTLVVPWRWSLGDRPFVDEENLAQIPSLLVYPFVKAFALVTANDVSGLVLYGRHLTLLLTLAVAVVVFFVVRRLVRWELALLIAALGVAFTFRGSAQVGSTTMAATLLMLGAVLGLRAVTEPPARGWALASGAALALAVVAYPTFLFVLPFYAVFLAFSLGDRVVAMITQGAFSRPPDPEGPPTGRTAWLVVSAWALGGAMTLGAVSLVLLSFGPRNLARCWDYTLAVGRDLGQLGGAAKAYQVASGLWDFAWTHPGLIVLALVALIIHRRWPTVGRLLLVALPAALWIAAQDADVGTPGFVLVYAALAPYVYVFVPGERRPDGARLLAWIWAPALLAGIMAAYTSSLGFVHASVGLFPATLCTAVLLAWSLETIRPFGTRAPWLACAALTGVLAVAVSVQYQQVGALRSQPTIRFSDGPWSGIRVTAAEHTGITAIAADLAAKQRPDDKLLVFYGGAALYLYWTGDVCANSYWIRAGEDGEWGPLPPETVAYYRRQRKVPTLAVHLVSTEGRSPSELRQGCGGLDYPAVTVSDDYAIHRKPPGDTVADVLERLPH